MKLIEETPFTKDLMINQVIEEMEWEKILTMMQSVGWSYSSDVIMSNGEVQSVPVTLKDIKDTAYELLAQATTSDFMEVSSGGFKATHIKNEELRLEFIGAECNDMPYTYRLHLAYLKDILIGKNLEEAEKVAKSYGYNTMVVQDDSGIDMIASFYRPEDMVVLIEKDKMVTEIILLEN